MDAVTEFAAAPPAQRLHRMGPAPKCEVYGRGDVRLYEILHARRNDMGETWAEVQAVLDGILGIEKPIHKDKFRYHWSGHCAHWDGVELP
jgi:hypothetical protein